MAEYKHGLALLSPEDVEEFESLYVEGVAIEAPSNNDYERVRDVGNWMEENVRQKETVRIKHLGRRFTG
tara:strand:+ start:279 stop:485 length:207 start_codon:yes stop_codon:yes gene_type:complete